jgi:hypothetical protein
VTQSNNNPPPDYQLIGPSEDGQVSDLLTNLTPKDGRLRLQALIAEWLRMENLVVLTGAGTSVSSNGKTMDNLEKAVASTVLALPRLPKAIADVIRLREANRIFWKPGSGSPPPVNFEDWLSYLSNASFIGASQNAPITGFRWRSGDPGPTQEDLSALVRDIGNAIFAECALILRDATPAEGAPVAPHHAFLAKLVARDSNLGRAHLFTLNYDTLFEQALELLGIQYFDGFTGRADARFDPSVYGLDMYYPGEVAEGRVRRFDKFLHLYKLHGSIHWRLDGAEIRARHPDLHAFEGYSRLSAEKKAERIGQFSAVTPAVGILPTANKFVRTLTMPFAHLFRSFQIRLSVPQTFLLVLGYGFGDDHVNRIIESALMNPSLVMLVVEPNPKSQTIERVQRYKDLGKRAFVLSPTEAAFSAAPYSRATFDDFSRSIMPDVRWLDDFLRLRRFEKQIQAAGPQVPPAADEPDILD